MTQELGPAVTLILAAGADRCGPHGMRLEDDEGCRGAREIICAGSSSSRVQEGPLVAAPLSLSLLEDGARILALATAAPSCTPKPWPLAFAALLGAERSQLLGCRCGAVTVGKAVGNVSHACCSCARAFRLADEEAAHVGCEKWKRRAQGSHCRYCNLGGGGAIAANLARREEVHEKGRIVHVTGWVDMNAGAHGGLSF